jgi:hypothetical protein
MTDGLHSKLDLQELLGELRIVEHLGADLPQSAPVPGGKVHREVEIPDPSRAQLLLTAVASQREGFEGRLSHRKENCITAFPSLACDAAAAGASRGAPAEPGEPSAL